MMYTVWSLNKIISLLRSNLFGLQRQPKDEAVLLHKRILGHVNFKNINKLVKGNMVRGLPSKTFKLDHSCLACRKGKQHKASCKKIKERTIREPLELLHMDLFGSVSVESVNRKTFLRSEKSKRKSYDCIVDLELLTPSMNYIPVRKENYADSGGKVSTYDDVEDLDDQQFIVHALHDELVSLMQSKNLLLNFIMMLKGNAFEEEKRRIALEKEKKNSDDDVPKAGVFSTNSFDDEYTDNEADGAPDYNNMDHSIDVSSTPILRINKNHPQSQIIGKSTAGRNPRKSPQALAKIESLGLEAMQDENYFNSSYKMYGSYVTYQKASEQEEGVDYDEVFAPVARIEAIRLFLAFASFMGFIVYQMDVKSAFLYGNITEEVYVKQPPGFEDPAHPNKVYRVVKALYGLHQAPRAWYERLSTFLLKHGYRRGAIDKTLFIKKDRRDIMLVQVYVDDIIFGSTKSSMVKDFEDLMQKEFKMSSMGELTFFLGLQVKQSNGGIFLSQDKYVKDILNKFDFRTIKPASTPIEAHKSLGKDEEGEDVDVHLYRSMIGCLMYLTASRPDIMFAVCLCARFQVTPKVSHLHAVKRIFRYLKHQPKLGLWYPKDSPFHLEAFSDSDYAGDNHDRRSTSGGCQYLGRRLVSWQCKKQTIVAISSTEAEYVAAASCCAQVLWMQNQLLDYGFNFMNTEIHIDNESTICIVKNPVFHSKTKHIQIRHHFIRDCYEQRLINVVKVHTDDNVADLLTKGFDLARFNFLVVTIGMMNP
ncbi:putative ribonuclease H-like domain-containing protein [Tanacetum coccineum]